MGHVDDTHDTECDRKADSREQQDRAKRQAVNDILDTVPDFEFCVDAGYGGTGGFTDRPRNTGERRQQTERLAPVPGFDCGDGCDLHIVCRAGIENGSSLGTLHQHLDPRILLRRQGLVQQRDGFRVAVLQDCFGSGPALRRVGAHQCQAADGGGDIAAQPVVDLDLIGRVARNGRQFCTAQRIGCGIIRAIARTDKHRFVSLRNIKIAGTQCVENGSGARRTAFGKF